MIKQVIILFFVSVLFSQLLSTELYKLIASDFETYDKTLYLLSYSFKENYQSLKYFCSESFYDSPKFILLQNYANDYFINFSISHENATQEFITENSNYKAFFYFHKNKEKNIWIIENCFLDKNIPTSHESMGFSPKSLERNFIDILDFQKDRTLIDYVNVASEFSKINEFTLITSNNKSLTLTNIFVHDGKEIKDFIYLILRYYPLQDREKNNKSGWLIDDFGSMLDFETHKENDYIKYLTQTLNLERKDLFNDDKYQFFNLRKEIDEFEIVLNSSKVESFKTQKNNFVRLYFNFNKRLYDVENYFHKIYIDCDKNEFSIIFNENIELLSNFETFTINEVSIEVNFPKIIFDFRKSHNLLTLKHNMNFFESTLFIDLYLE